MRTHVAREAEDTAVIFYTSGTTGRPKGALLTHLNLVMNSTVNAFDANPIRRDDVVMGCLPLFHTFGQTVSMNSTFRVGATLLLQPRFDPDAAIALMHHERATLFFGVPTMYVQLLDAAPRAAALPELRDCVSGGASLPVVVLERFEKAFSTTVFEGYGLSETSPTASVNQPWFGTRAGTVGHPIWGVEVEVADETVDDRVELLPPGGLGEIVIRGHNVFAGYLDDPERHRRGHRRRLVPDRRHRHGRRRGRLHQHRGPQEGPDHPRRLQRLPARGRGGAERHPAVAQVAVIGVPDDEKGEEICAVVVPASPVDAEELIAWSREQLGRHKYPRRVEVLDALPIGPSHKVLKRELRTQYSKGTS